MYVTYVDIYIYIDVYAMYHVYIYIGPIWQKL